MVPNLSNNVHLVNDMASRLREFNCQNLFQLQNQNGLQQQMSRIYDQKHNRPRPKRSKRSCNAVNKRRNVNMDNNGGASPHGQDRMKRHVIVNVQESNSNVAANNQFGRNGSALGR